MNNFSPKLNFTEADENEKSAKDPYPVPIINLLLLSNETLASIGISNIGVKRLDK